MNKTLQIVWLLGLTIIEWIGIIFNISYLVFCAGLLALYHYTLMVSGDLEK